MAAIVREICAVRVEPDDGLVFDAATVKGERIAEAADYEGVRIRFRATLDAARIQMQLDVGFGDIVVPAAMLTTYPTILVLPAPRLLAYSKETAVAEKFEAMVRLGELNSRIKDFFDIWLLSCSFDFDGPTICEAIEKTFERRSTVLPIEVPAALTAAFSGNPQKQAQWAGFVRRMKLRDVPALAQIVEDIREFLMPPMRLPRWGRLRSRMDWSPAEVGKRQELVQMLAHIWVTYSGSCLPTCDGGPRRSLVRAFYESRSVRAPSGRVTLVEDEFLKEVTFWELLVSGKADHCSGEKEAPRFLRGKEACRNRSAV